MPTSTYDYVIIGAGSAGCVLANRLSANPACTVLLVEAGGNNNSIFINMPSALSIPMNTRRFNWGFESEPESGMNNRRLDCPRGLGLGGSSAINGMVYVRGHPEDFNRWASLGARGWAYADCLPYFKAAETCTAANADPALRGATGPLTTHQAAMSNPLYEAFLVAAEQAGYTRSGDLNGARQEGFGGLPATIADGIRCSAKHAYLTPEVRARDNLTIRTNTLCHRIEFDGDRAHRAVLQKQRTVEAVTAQTEIVLCAGPVGSPAILQRSGVGPEALLNRLGIQPAHVNAAVGANLMDHLEVYVQQACTPRVSLNRRLGLLSKALIGARWLATRRGLGATNHFEAGGFVRSSEDAPWPDIQFHFLPAAIRYDGTLAAERAGFQAHVGPMLPTSRGHVAIRSTDAAVHPEIVFNYLSDPEERRVFRRAIEIAREIFAQPALKTFSEGEISPGEAVQSADALDAWIRDNAESAYHPCGTCRMSDDDGVVDSAARVHGLRQLRVADSSIFPFITNGNLNAPTIMAAEKIAHAMIADA